MNKQNIISAVAVGLIFVTYSYFSSKQSEQYRAELAEYNARQEQTLMLEAVTNNISAELSTVEESNKMQTAQELGAAVCDLEYKTQNSTLSNEVMDLHFSAHGGQVVGVTLKDYYKYSDSVENRQLVELFQPQSAMLDFEYYVAGEEKNIKINTSQEIFEILPVQKFDDYQELTMRLHFAQQASMDVIYKLYNTAQESRNYMVDIELAFDNMASTMVRQNSIGVKWREKSYQNERGFTNENNYTTIAYHYKGESSSKNIGVSDKNKSEKSTGAVEWVAFKQQFFSSILIAPESFSYANMWYETAQPNSGFIKTFAADMSLAYNDQTTRYKLAMYYGANDYHTLCDVNTLGYGELNTQSILPLGWGIFGWVNKKFIIPIFDFLSSRISNYGLIIFILALIVKIVTLFPTLSSYKSMAKMRVIKPEVDEINKKYSKPEEATKRQTATMELYQKAGINPLGGCIPMLIQMPIIFAVFRFFPTSIGLRGASFLWAHDLASYDSVLKLPFSIPFYGEHVSLFALLLAISMFGYSYMTMKQNSSTQPEMAGMNAMMLYMMPVMMLVIFNNYSSGLCFYYLVANVITMIQTMIIRRMIDDNKIHALIKANSSKNTGGKKSKFQQRYEEMVAQAEAENKKRK